MRYALVLIIALIGAMIHGQMVPALDTGIIQVETAISSDGMSCCEEATGPHSGFACAAHAVPGPFDPWVLGARPGRLVFRIEDVIASGRSAAPPEVPPRRV
ncbi:MAG: hypothetical protein ROR55_16120 [Devosia sp.]